MIGNEDDPLLTVRQVARGYGVHAKTVRRWIRKGIIAVIRVGPYRTVRIKQSEAARHFTAIAGADTGSS